MPKPLPPSPHGSAPLPTALAKLVVRLPALVFIAVILAGAIQLLLASRQLSDLPHQMADIGSGGTSLALEKQLNTHLPLREALISGANGLRYLLLRGASPEVRVGRNGWLFLAEEMQPHKNADANMQTRIAIIQKIAAQLAADGVTLLVLPVPDKLRLYPEHAYQANPQTERYSQALALLAQHHITHIDPLPALQQAAAQNVYYRSDTHWNQRGAQIVAQALAQKLADHIKHMRQSGKTPADLQWDASEFATQSTGAEQERAGDLLRLMGLEHSPNWLRPQPDRETPLKTVQTSAKATGGLLDDNSVPVVLAGTSYSLRGNFHGFLQQALHADILNTAQDGGGFLQSISAYLANQAYQSAKPKLLIWEIPERFLTQPLKAELTWQWPGKNRNNKQE